MTISIFVFVGFGTVLSVLQAQEVLGTTVTHSVHLNVCIRSANGTTAGCVTCSPCASIGDEDWLITKCLTAYQDCSLLCSYSDFEWSNEAIQQEYAEVLQSKCHYLQIVKIQHNDSLNGVNYTADKTDLTTPLESYKSNSGVTRTLPLSIDKEVNEDEDFAVELKSDSRPDVLTITFIVLVCVSITTSVTVVCGLKKRKSLKKFFKLRWLKPESTVKKWQTIIDKPDIHSKLTENIDPEDLLIHLGAEVFSQSEEQEILAACREKGKVKACERLFSILVSSKNPCWYEILLNKLKESRQWYVYAELLTTSYLETYEQDVEMGPVDV